MHSENKKIRNWPGPKNSGPNPKGFRFLVADTSGPRQIGPLLEEILATCLVLHGKMYTEIKEWNDGDFRSGGRVSELSLNIASARRCEGSFVRLPVL